MFALEKICLQAVNVELFAFESFNSLIGTYFRLL